MKSALFGLIMAFALNSFACPDLSGTYKVDYLKKSFLNVEQNGCLSATIKALDVNGKVLAMRTDYFDGKLRNSQWVDGELVTMNWNGGSLHQVFYLKDDGTFIDSVISQNLNGDLSETQNEYILQSHRTINYVWKKQ